MRILFVDDDPDMRDLIELALGFEGFEVVTASGLDDARVAVAGERFEAVVCDYFLGGDQTGPQLRDHLRTLGMPTPFVITTGDAGAVAGMSPAPDAILQKPIEASQLAAVLRDLTPAR